MKTDQQLIALALSRQRHLIEHLKRGVKLAESMTLGAINKRDAVSLGETINHAARCFHEFAALANALE